MSATNASTELAKLSTFTVNAIFRVDSQERVGRGDEVFLVLHDSKVRVSVGCTVGVPSRLFQSSLWKKFEPFDSYTTTLTN